MLVLGQDEQESGNDQVYTGSGDADTVQFSITFTDIDDYYLIIILQFRGSYRHAMPLIFVCYITIIIINSYN